MKLKKKELLCNDPGGISVAERIPTGSGRQWAIDGLDYQVCVGAGDYIPVIMERLYPLSFCTQSDTLFAKQVGLLLQSSRIGKDFDGIHSELKHVKITKWLGQDNISGDGNIVFQYFPGPRAVKIPARFSG
jgi:hypothetical protein